jgi:hypothetical protein
MKHALALLLLTFGCATTPTTFTPYEGAQRKWPIEEGGLVRRKEGFTVYIDAPSKPYDVLGLIDTSNEAAAIRMAKSKGADAIMFLDSETKYAGTYHSPSTNTRFPNGMNVSSPNFHRPIHHTTATYAAIKFK